MVAYDYQLLLKCSLEHGVAWAPDQEILYRDQVRQTYRAMYLRVLCLAGAATNRDENGHCRTRKRRLFDQ